MKYLLTFVLIGFVQQFSMAQCTANAGPDQHSCPNDSTAFLQLGGNPTASLGIPPYAYSWSIKPIQWFPGIKASDLLNDTTAANPFVIDRSLYDTIIFYLNVTDSIGNTCADSCMVTFSNFTHFLYYYTFDINEGDSLYLNHGLDVLPQTYMPVQVPLDSLITCLWRPDRGLKDSTTCSGFWAKPDSSVKYYVTITDHFGCSDAGGPFYQITVHPIGMAENALNEYVSIYPNPSYGIINIKKKGHLEILSLRILNLMGETVFICKNNYDQIDISHLHNGIYVLSMETDQGVIRKKIERK